MFEVAEGDGEQGGEEAAVDCRVTMALTGPCDIGCAFEILEFVIVSSGAVDSAFGPSEDQGVDRLFTTKT